MGKQGVVAVEDMSNGIDLMGAQGDFGIDAAEIDVLTVILTGANGVEFLVIFFYEGLPPVSIVPYPIPKRMPKIFTQIYIFNAPNFEMTFFC